MTRAAEIRAHIGSMAGLLDVVGAMRSLASMRVQEAHQALPGVRHYAQLMADAIGSVLLLTPDGPVPQASPTGRRRALVLCMGEHGFIGGFNERLLEAAKADFTAGDKLFILGSRGAALAQEKGQSIAWSNPMATRLPSVQETVRRLAAELYRLIARGEVTSAAVMFARAGQGSASSIERRRLFPLDLPWNAAATEPPSLPPLHNLAPAVLLEKLIGEYVFALLTEAATESLASENAARFSAMEAAHDNVSKKLALLRRQGRQARQDEITTELLDVVTGAGALEAFPTAT